MFIPHTFLLVLGLSGLAIADCPYMDGESEIKPRQDDGFVPDKVFLQQFEVDDSNMYTTSDAGGPIEDDRPLKAGERGPTLLEDFIFRQKIQHFDHERVPERAVHARGAGAHGAFISNGNWSNITAASFLAEKGKRTPVFVRFSTVAGSRGSTDVPRDVRGFATRFYTDEGNFDIVGNNIPVFFLQDAILFPDLIHAVKPTPDREIPQAATAHDTAWDFFSQQPSCLHTLFWACAGNGIPRSYRHMDGFGIHTFRFVTDAGESKLIKWFWKSKQGRASLVWEEAQVLSGKNSDFHRQDLHDAIESGNGPRWDLGVQIIDESDALSFGFDLLDPTKILPEELVPVTILGTMTLDTNPKNYFAETEQVMASRDYLFCWHQLTIKFQPGHIVRGIDFTEDPLLQGRLYSYLDTQLNRNGGPNFEQLPINRPHVPVHNNNRDGAGQNFIHLNPAAYTPNNLGQTLMQANQTQGRGFFTAPGRSTSGMLTRATSPTFADVWSQPRMFYNSLVPAEQQFLINAMRFEMAHLKSSIVKSNTLIQLNRVSNDIATRVAQALGMKAPAPDPTYYNDNSTKFVTIFGNRLPTIATLNVGVLTSLSAPISVEQASALASAFSASGVNVITIGEMLQPGINQTYSAADASTLDGVIVAAGAESLFINASSSTFFPAGRPLQILTDAYRWGKPVGALGTALRVMKLAGVTTTPGVYTEGEVEAFAASFEDGLKTFRFVDRFSLD